MVPSMLLPPSLTSLLPFLLLLSLPFTSISTTLPVQKQGNALLQSRTMDPAERETLFLVMESVSSDRDWRVSNPDPCSPGSSWTGIECKPGLEDGYFHVTRLDFGTSYNPTCKKTATFPTEIFKLPYLQAIFFFDCFRTIKTTFSIPSLPTNANRTTTSSLQQLSLKSNAALVGSIPPQISSLKSLQILTLSQNDLHGEIQKGISSLTSLIHLDLSYNSLTGSIPDQIGNLRNLVGLDLSYNSLTGSVPPSIGHLGLLQKLDLSSNSLTGNIPDSIENLSFLVFMALANNRLRGPFPEGLPKLRSIQYLILEDNPMFTKLPFQLGKLEKLQELRLANSGYWGSIPESFAWLRNLTALSLQKNRLTGEIPAGLSGLGRIYHLNLSRNMLVGVIPFDAGFMRRLGRNLDLSGNPGLCFNGSGSSDSITAGVDLCGATNRSASMMQQPLKKSHGAPRTRYNPSSLCFSFFFILELSHLLF